MNIVDERYLLTTYDHSNEDCNISFIIDLLESEIG